MPEDFRLEIRSEPCLLGSVRSLVRSWVIRHGFDQVVADRAVLAIDEACANAMRHAYAGRCDEVLELALRSSPGVLEFVLSDRGIPCPEEKLARRQLSAPDPDALCPGGLGIQLMYEVFDEVAFRPDPECGNCVTMRLHRPSEGSS